MLIRHQKSVHCNYTEMPVFPSLICNDTEVVEPAAVGRSVAAGVTVSTAFGTKITRAQPPDCNDSSRTSSYGYICNRNGLHASFSLQHYMCLQTDGNRFQGLLIED